MAQEAKIILTAEDNTSQAIGKVQSKLKLLKSDSGNASEGVKKLEDSFSDLGKELVGVSGFSDKFADSLMAFAGGGFVVAAVAAGIGLLVKLFTDLKQTQADLKASSETLAETLARVTGQEVEFNLEKRTKELRKAEKALLDASRGSWDEAGRLITAASMGLPNGGRMAGGVIGGWLSRSADKAQAEYNKALAAFLDAEKRANDKSKTEEERRAAAAEAAQKRQELASKQAADNIKRSEAEKQKAFDAALRASQDSIRQQIDEYNSQTDALTRLVDMGVRTPQLTQALTDAVQQQSLVLANTTPLTKQYADELERLNRLKSAMTTASASPFINIGGVLLDPKVLNDIVEAKKKTDSEMKKQQSVKEAEENMLNLSLKTQLASDSFNILFENLGSGGKYFENVGRAYARMMSGIAKQKAVWNLAEGTEALAKSFGWIALGNFASSAAAKTAAVGHFKAAAMWGAVAGAAGAAGGAGGGGSSGAVGTGGGTGRDEDFSRGMESNIYIQGGILDTSNPEQMRALANAIQNLSGRRVNLVGA